MAGDAGRGSTGPGWLLSGVRRCLLAVHRAARGDRVRQAIHRAARARWEAELPFWEGVDWAGRLAGLEESTELDRDGQDPSGS